MSKFTYQGNNSSMKVTGVLFVKGVETELTAEQAKALKDDHFGKAFLEDGTIVESKAKADDKNSNAKPVSKMTVSELEIYITDNGGTFTGDDNKPDLLAIAQAIEDTQAEK